jgi:hypothetical protein
MAKRLTRAGEDGALPASSPASNRLGVAGAAVGLALAGFAGKVGDAEAALPMPTFEASTLVDGASTPGVHEGWATVASAEEDSDPDDGATDVKVLFTETDLEGSYSTQKHLSPGSSVPTDVGVTSGEFIWNCQNETSTTALCLDDSLNIQEITDTSADADWSDGTMTKVAGRRDILTPSGETDTLDLAGEISVDPTSGDKAYTVYSSPSGGDTDIYFSDGTPIATSAEDETQPLLDSDRERVFYRKDGAMWMADSSGGSAVEVPALDDCYYPYIDKANGDWYCAELNADGDYDLTVRKETTDFGEEGGGDDTGEPDDTGGSDTGGGDTAEPDDTGGEPDDSGDSGETGDTNDSGETGEPTETGDSGDTGNGTAEECTEDGERYITTEGTYEAGDEICLDDGSAETTGGTADVEDGEIILNADGDAVDASGDGLIVQSSDYNDIWTEVNGRAGIDLGGEDQSGTEAARGRSVAPGSPEDEANLNDTPKKPTNVKVYEGIVTVHGGNDDWKYTLEAGESGSFSDTIDGVAASNEDTGNENTGETPVVRHTENDPEGCGCVTASTPLTPEGAVKKGFWAGVVGLIGALRRRKRK